MRTPAQEPPENVSDGSRPRHGLGTSRHDTADTRSSIRISIGNPVPHSCMRPRPMQRAQLVRAW
eukprot:3342481-Prymnesium_polylepis.3